MDGSQQPAPGFSSHVQDQLDQAILSVSQSSRGRGQSRRGRGNYHHSHQYQQPPPPRNYYHNSHMQFGNQPPQQTWNNQVTANPTDLNSFPPLGASRPNVPPKNHQTQHTSNQQQFVQPSQAQQLPNASYVNQIQHNPQPSQPFRRDYPVRARGGHHKGGNQAGRNSNQNQQQVAWDQSSTSTSNDYRRPLPTHNKLFAPGGQPYFNNPEQQRAYQRKVMDQSDFLNHLANQSLKSTQLTAEEQQTKELFRKELEGIAQKVVAEAKDLSFDPQNVQLKLYGSLGSGFGVAGCDMDLLLAFPQDVGPIGDIEVDSRRMLERALLDAGIGARLLTNTRVPILRVCQTPDEELLKNLREYRANWEQSLLESDPGPIDDDLELLSALTMAQVSAAEKAFAGLDSETRAMDIPLPASPPPEHTRLEYTDGCGIQCDINFSNYVALHNTRLLRTYGLSDPRVRQVGVFVKAWAKARDINTPYYGTLSSYGYILMVLHYLMNIASPPVIPNLQDLAKNGWEGPADRDLVEGFDVRFVKDMDEVKAIMEGMPRNHESVGSLLRGFFHYYANPRGFRWNQDVVSIRTRGGQINKRAKGWTEAKWSNENQSVRLRYLLAIEDPFELEHNVARTVGHSGIVAIRDEFRRAWNTIENVQFDDETKTWLSLNWQGQKESGDNLMAPFEKRGDLLRKDQDYHRQKLRQIRREFEAKEKALKNANLEETENAEETEQSGTFNIEAFDTTGGSLPPSLSAERALTHHGASQVHEDNQLAFDHEADLGNGWQTESVDTTLVSTDIDWDVSFTTAELGLGEDEQTNDDVANTELSSTINVREIPSSTFEASVTGKVESVQIPISATWIGRSSEPSTTEELQPHIPWDNTTVPGRWLLWRDRKIRSGTWSESEKSEYTSNNQYVELDRTFPYNPDMSVAELARKNEMLRTNAWRETKRKVKKRRKYGERTPRSVDPKSNTRTVESNPMELHADESINQSQKPQVSMDAVHLLDEALPVIEPQTSRSPVLEHKGRPETGELLDREAVQDSSFWQGLEPSRKEPDPLHEDSDFPKAWGTHTPLVQDASRTHAQARNVSFKESASLSEQSTTTAFPRPQPRSTTQLKQELPKIYADLVPLTFHPTISSAQRPHDESSPTTPVPRKPNFALDPRQLADLEIIRRGGNGCARAGEEYSIERDYEWGGGGELAGRSTSSGIEQLSGA